MTDMDELRLAADNPCDADCGGTIGRDWVMCQKGDCFHVFCRPCGEDHELVMHIGPRERAVLTAWQLDAEERKRKP